MPRKDDIIVGLDIGTTKICAMVGTANAKGEIEIIGLGTSQSRGLKKGVVVNIDSTVDSIRKAVEEAENMAQVEINEVYTGIAGGHIMGFNSRGVIAIKESEVKQADIARVIEAAQAVAIPTDRQVIHVLPREFKIDGEDGIREPMGMSGVRLEAEVHIVTAAVTSVQNIVKSCHKAGLEVNNIVLQQLASSYAALSEDEKDLGVALIDIGGGTTDIAIFMEGAIWHTSVVALGGNNITNDIAIGLRTPASEAERIKVRHGCAMTAMVDGQETIEVPSVGGRKPRVLSRQILSEIIEPRVEEIFVLARQELRKAGLEEMVASGIVITGGSSLLEGMPELAEQVFNVPVRRGIPREMGGLTDIIKNPIYTTGLGLVLFGSEHRGKIFPREINEKRGWNRIYRTMRDWFKDLF
jgi:cell division protein FtsA